MDFTAVDVMLEEDRCYEAFDVLSQMKNEDGVDLVKIYPRLANACYLKGTYAKDEKREAFMREGFDFIQAAYELSPLDPLVLRWAPVLAGAISDCAGSMKDRICFGKLFKRFINEAINELSIDFALLHMRGRFAFEVANIGFFEKHLATEIFGEAPKATFEEALDDFLAAEEIYTGAIDNTLYLAKTYYALKQYNKAKEYAERVIQMKAVDCLEKEHVSEAYMLLPQIPEDVVADAEQVKNQCD